MGLLLSPSQAHQKAPKKTFKQSSSCSPMPASKHLELTLGLSMLVD